MYVKILRYENIHIQELKRLKFVNSNFGKVDTRPTSTLKCLNSFHKCLSVLSFTLYYLKFGQTFDCETQN